MLQRSSLAERGDPQRQGKGCPEEKSGNEKGNSCMEHPSRQVLSSELRAEVLGSSISCRAVAVWVICRDQTLGEREVSLLPQLCRMEAQEPAPLKGSHRLVLGCLRRFSGWTDDLSGTLSSLFLAHRTIFHHYSCTLYILDLNIWLHSFISFFNQFMILV